MQLSKEQLLDAAQAAGYSRGLVDADLMLVAINAYCAQADARPVAEQWKTWVHEWMGEHDVILPTQAYTELLGAHPEASAPGLSVEDAMRIVMANWGDKAAIEKAFAANLTRASAATVAEPSGGTPDTYPARLLHESDASLAERVDSWHKRHPQAAQQQAEQSEPWRERLIELADQLDAELTTGVQWSNAQFACFYVSDDLRKIVKKAGGVPNEKDWKTRALEAEKLNRQFMDRWNAENGPTHMGEPVIAAQQQAEPVADEIACSSCGLTMEDSKALAAMKQAEPVGDEREDSGSLLGDGFVLEFERWNDVTGALPRGGSWMAEVSDIIQRAAQSGQRAGVVEGTKLWLWKNGDHYLAYRHLYPCYTPGGDPMTLGEPVGYAEFRESHDRAAASTQQQEGGS